MFAVIGGSGLTRIPELEITGRRIVRTPYGLPSAPLLTGRSGGRELVFLARHGLNHTLAPHEINYRANIWALKSLDVVGIVAVSAVTSLNSDWGAGSLVLPDDLIDYTSARSATFFENDNCGVVHTDFTEPYDAALRQTLLEHAAVRETVLAIQTWEKRAVVEDVRFDGHAPHMRMTVVWRIADDVAGEIYQTQIFAGQTP